MNAIWCMVFDLDAAYVLLSVCLCMHVHALQLHIKLTFTVFPSVIVLASAAVAIRNVNACSTVSAWTRFAIMPDCTSKQAFNYLYCYNANYMYIHLVATRALVLTNTIIIETPLPTSISADSEIICKRIRHQVRFSQ